MDKNGRIVVEYIVIFAIIFMIIMMFTQYLVISFVEVLENMRTNKPASVNLKCGHSLRVVSGVNYLIERYKYVVE